MHVSVIDQFQVIFAGKSHDHTSFFSELQNQFYHLKEISSQGTSLELSTDYGELT